MDLYIGLQNSNKSTQIIEMETNGLVYKIMNFYRLNIPSYRGKKWKPVMTISSKKTNKV